MINNEILAVVEKGFQVAEQLAEGWLLNFAKIHGDAAVLNLNMEDTTMEDIIMSYPGIDTFLGAMSGDYDLFHSMPRRAELGMVDNGYDSHPVFAKAWAIVIKTYLREGVDVLTNTISNPTHALSAGLDVDRVHVPDGGTEEEVVYVGGNKINIDALFARLGRDAAIALYALFHSTKLQEFDDILTKNAEGPGSTPPETINTFARVKRFYVEKKDDGAEEAVRHALDRSTIKLLTQGDINTN